MIERVLEIIVESGTAERREIAKQAGIQIETLDDIIGLLCQRGYLRPNDQQCMENPSCSGCSLVESCDSSGKLGRTLFVTEKGRQLLKSMREKKK